MKYWCLVIFIFSISNPEINSQFVDSPCPDTFTYVNDGDNVYGEIRVTLPADGLSTVVTKANFTIAAQVNSRYAGKLQVIQNGRTTDGQYLMVYRVHFPVSSPRPRLTTLTVNDNILCYGPGDVAGPGQYVTTIGLQHMYFIGSSGGNIIYNTQPTRPNQSPVDFYSSIINNFKNQNNPATEYTQNFEDSTGKIKKVFYSYNSQNLHQSGIQGPNYYDIPHRHQQETIPVRPVEHVYETRPQPPPPPPVRPMATPPPPPPPAPIPPRQNPSPVQTSHEIECGVVANDAVSLIYNGLEYSRGDIPWLVAIYKRTDAGLIFICSGTLISNHHVVTAGHCVQSKSSLTPKKDIVVKIGVFDLDDWTDDITQTRNVQSIHIHEEFNATIYKNDISVFTLSKRVEYNNEIRPACLWRGNTDLRRIVRQTGIVAGWGKSEHGDAGQSTPRMVRVPIVSTSDCRASRPEFHTYTSSSTLCAGDRNGAGPCSGDSGGGLYLKDNGRWRLRGVVSLSLRAETGDSACNLNEYLVFTDAAKYIDWIKRVVG